MKRWNSIGDHPRIVPVMIKDEPRDYYGNLEIDEGG